MSSRLRFAIIGCGRIATRHAEEAKRQGALVAVCDIVESRAAEFGSKYGCQFYTSLDELLRNEKEIDVIAICTPNGLHAEQSIKALNAGIHVLCEKPLCIQSYDGRKMVEAALANQKSLFVVKSNRYNPVIADLKKQIDAGIWGKIFSFQLNCFWNRPPSYYDGSWHGTQLDGGPLFTQFSHYLDTLLWLLGEVRTINGLRKNYAHLPYLESEDTGVITLEMENGVIGGMNWSVNSYQKNMEVSISILTEKGSIRIGGAYMNEIEYSVSEVDLTKEPSNRPSNDYGGYKGSMSNHDKIYENLVMAINDSNHPFTSGMDGLRTVELIERIYSVVRLTQ